MATAIVHLVGDHDRHPLKQRVEWIGDRHLMSQTPGIMRPLRTKAAENWAIVASLIETCKLNRVDPQAYMADVLTKIVNGHLASKLDELMPWAYAKPIALKDVP